MTAIEEINSLKARLYDIENALTKIANWELPESGKFWDIEKKEPMSYEAAFGSNGARDYIRSLAINTLKR